MSKHQHWLIRKAFDKLFYYIVAFVLLYVSLVIFIHYEVPDIPFINSFFSALVSLMPTLKTRLSTLRYILSYLPGHKQTFWVLSNLQRFFTQLFSLLIHLPGFSNISFSLYAIRTFFVWWFSPVFTYFVQIIFRWFGFSQEFEKYDHNFTRWILKVKFVKDRKDCRSYTQPFYPIILQAYNTENDRKWKEEKDGLPESLRYIWDVKRMKEKINPFVAQRITSYTWSCAKYYFFNRGFEPETSFEYLFNFNRHLLVRFIVFSRVKEGFNPDDVSEILHDLYVSDSYKKEIENDSNFWTGDWDNSDNSDNSDNN